MLLQNQTSYGNPYTTQQRKEEVRALFALISEAYGHRLHADPPPWDTIGHAVVLFATNQVEECRRVCAQADELHHTDAEKIDLCLIGLACKVLEHDNSAEIDFNRFAAKRIELAQEQWTLVLRLHALAVGWDVIEVRA